MKFMIRTEFLSHRNDNKNNPLGSLGWFEIRANDTKSNPIMVKLLGFDDHHRWRMLHLQVDDDPSEITLFQSEFVITHCALLNNDLKSGASMDVWHLLEHAVTSGCDSCSEKKILHTHLKLRLCKHCIDTHNPRLQLHLTATDDDTASEDSDYILPSHHEKTMVAVSTDIPLTRAIRKSLVPSSLNTLRGNNSEQWDCLHIYSVFIYILPIFLRSPSAYIP